MNNRNWTVARFPNGTWSTGGFPNSPEYEDCEVFIIYAPDRDTAKRRAQAKRARQRKKNKESL